LRCWGIHRRPLRKLDNAFGLTLRWIGKYEPMLMVVPDYEKGSRKGRRAQAIIEMVASAAAEREIACIRLARPKIVTNKYTEAASLAAIYPQLAPLVPLPRRTWDSERHGMLVFEAAAIVHDWLWRNDQSDPLVA
jgi:hypothetical protein